MLSEKESSIGVFLRNRESSESGCTIHTLHLRMHRRSHWLARPKSYRGSRRAGIILASSRLLFSRQICIHYLLRNSYTMSSSSPSSSPVDRMNDYKGTPFPGPIIPLSGLAFGAVLPCVIFSIMDPQAWTSSDPTEGIMLLLETFSLISLLFLTEFFWGVSARVLSPKASFSPAAAQVSGTEPFQVVQSNRIHQNHIESACIYVPAALAAAAAGINIGMIMATTVTWVVSRGLYRLGYCQENPFWRNFGTFSSLAQSFACLGLFVHAKMQ